MRIVFIGAVEFSRRSLEHLLASDAQVSGVCTLRSSSFNADHADLSGICESRSVPWTYAEDINSAASRDWIAERRPDVIFCFGWSRLLQRPLLELAPLGVVGFHPAALPANRGRHPLIWTLVLGLTRTASTFFFMDERADAGDILSQRQIDITADDNATTLYEKVVVTARVQMDEFVPQLASGKFPRTVQDDRLASSWRKRGPADSQIDWRMSSRSIHNLVRGLGKPYVGAHFVFSGSAVKVWRTRVVPGTPTNAEPGKVLSVTREGPVVSCGEQAILLLDTEPPAVGLSAGQYLP